MKIIGWNINGARSKSMNILNADKTFNTDSHLANMLKKYKPDVVCFGETKCQDKHTALFDCLPFTHKTWICSKGRKGYSGVCILSNKEFIDRGSIPIEDNDLEGRSRIVEFDDCILIYVYTPNSGGRYEYRQIWDDNVYEYLIDLHTTESKPIIYSGDLNVVNEPIDIYNKKTLLKGVTAGTLPHERQMFKGYLEYGYVDIWREKNPDVEKYTWWNYRTRARKRNLGWRSDYFLVHEDYTDKIKDVKILDEVLGSDHCPIYIEI